ncbi:MAG: hypothetical protein HGB21_15310 [Nitrospirae bacterium]|nr:hypothetical protein [Nitrospirota bacterium]
MAALVRDGYRLGNGDVKTDARLIAEPPEAGEQLHCCSFATRDAFSAVVAFYEKALRQKAMDPKTYEKAYPAEKLVAEAARQAYSGGKNQAPPPGVQLRIFVLKVDQIPGLGKMPTETFTVALANGETYFDISEDRLGPGGEKYVHEFRKTHGLKSSEDRAYEDWKENHPPARQDRYSLPVYPGAVVADELRRSSTCYNVVLQTRDPFEKVVAFYRERLKGKLPESDTNGREGYEGMFIFIDYRYNIAEPGERDLPGTKTRVLGKKGSANRDVEIQRAGPDENYQSSDEKNNRYSRSASVQINLLQTVLDVSCAAIPKGAVWKENEKVDPMAYSGFRIRED